ncbi:MAG TPA: flagellar hook-length control protein FliK, partial [Solirubrobacteraceae bacterium]|nr:flagellar hook-length control protein FliK [Solirubrobacteraceae bacterium]
ITRARLHISPAELGAIELHLRHTASGLTARVIADSPEAAAQLQQNSDQLKQVLDQAGIGLLGLDIGARGDQAQQSFAGLAGGAFGDASSRGGSRGGQRFAGSTDDEQIVAVPVRARLPIPGSGGLLDVIA